MTLLVPMSLLGTPELCTRCLKPLPEIAGGIWRSPLPRPTVHAGYCKAVCCWSCGAQLTVANTSPSILKQRKGRCRACDKAYQKSPARRAAVLKNQRDRYQAKKAAASTEKPEREHSAS